MASMSAAAALLDRLGRPGDVRLGTASPGEVARLSTGLAALDDALGGGLPRGRMSEIAGPRSAGRTGLTCAIAACATRRGEAVAWVDVEDALDAEAAAAAGVALERTLWVRPRTPRDAARAAQILLGAGGFGLVVLDLGADPPMRGTRMLMPLARAAERSRTALVVVTPRRTTGSDATVSLEATTRRVRWSGGAGRLVMLEAIEAQVTVARSRIGRPGGAVVVRQACA
jgi:hypothetical protein